MGIGHDPWQQGFGTVALGCLPSGEYAASIGGVVASIPRQVGKTYTVGSILIAIAIEFPGTRIVWTSHHGRTTTNTFRSMAGVCRRKAVVPHMAPTQNNGVRSTNGEQELAFANGSIIMFGAREQGFGRGMDAIDIEVFDEAQILSIKALEDMVPAVNQSRHPHGGLVFFIGTPPRPGVDDGEAFTEMRLSAIKGSSEHQVYIEFSADPTADIDDRSQWPIMNPSYPHRTPLAAMLRMRKLIPDDDSWRREAMGIWPDPHAAVEPPVIDPERWRALEVGGAPDGAVSYAVRFSASGEVVALAGAVRPEAGPVHVEGIDQRLVVDGTRWLVEWLAARKAPVVIDGRAGSGALAAALRRAGVPASRIIRPTVDEAIAAHAGFVEAVTSGEVTHIADEALAVDDVVRRPIGTQGGWGFRGRDGQDVSLIESAALAHWVLAAKKPKRSTSSGGRRVVVPA